VAAGKEGQWGLCQPTGGRTRLLAVGSLGIMAPEPEPPTMGKEGDL